MIKDLLTEKLRPKKLEHLILPERVRKALSNGVTQHMLFYGSPGTGKTSAARVISQGYSTKYINVSDESSVETIRTKINDFCSTASVLHGFDAEGGSRPKVVILDEIEGGSDQFMKALRGVMEKFTNARFIATTNYLTKLSDPIISRFECISFDFEGADEEREVRAAWKARVGDIMQRLGIAHDDAALERFAVANFPDMRRTLNKVQGMVNRGVSALDDAALSEHYEFEPMWQKMVTPKGATPYENFCLLMGEYSSSSAELIESTQDEFIHWLAQKHPAKANCIPEVIIESTRHAHYLREGIDPVVVAQSLFFSVQKIVTKYNP
jgi:DNA polymerase III delta prime subunit